MRREGRKHGMLRTFPTLPIQRSPRRTINELSTLPTAGIFTEAPSKPTNHSKFTGNCIWPQCPGCVINPAWKSKNKVKGAYKARSMDPLDGVKVSGYSAMEIMVYLDGDGNEACDSDH